MHCPADAPGVFRLTKENWLELMGDRPTDALWGIGARTSEKLTELGISTVRELGATDLDTMRARFGPKTGPWLVSLGRGLGDRTVTSAPWVPRGRSRETTYEHDVVERTDLEDKLRQLAADVVADVAPTGRAITHVGIKVRFVPFFTTTRVHKLPEPTVDTATVATGRRRAGRPAGAGASDPAARRPRRADRPVVVLPSGWVQFLGPSHRQRHPTSSARRPSPAGTVARHPQNGLRTHREA